MNNYPSQARSLLELVKSLQIRGYKKKELASILEIPAPVFSSLLKNILPVIAQVNEDNDNLEERISYAFSQVNNMSANKTLQQLNKYITKLENSLKNNLTQTNSRDYFSLIKEQSCKSYEFTRQYFEGLYEFYYISTERYIVKKEPFWIRTHPIEKYVEVFKGNKNSTLLYKGIGIITNNQTMTFQLSEINDIPNEYLMIHVTLPFTRKTDHLRGVFSAISFAREPIARKVVLRKIADFCNEDEFNRIQTQYFDRLEDAEIPEIYQYLFHDPSMIECYSIPKPKFNISDLIEEIKVSSQFKEKI